MKCNYKKINEFFNNSILEQDVKDFAFKLLKYFCNTDEDIFISKMFLYAIDCYSVEDSVKLSEYDDDDLNIIDFHKLSKLDKKLRKFVIKLLVLAVTDEANEFIISFIKDDLKILVTYKDWKSTERKNKLEKLNDC